RPPPCATLFPYPTLFRSDGLGHALHRLRGGVEEGRAERAGSDAHRRGRLALQTNAQGAHLPVIRIDDHVIHLADDVSSRIDDRADRKSTRLNSSHVKISY